MLLTKLPDAFVLESVFTSNRMVYETYFEPLMTAIKIIGYVDAYDKQSAKNTIGGLEFNGRTWAAVIMINNRLYLETVANRLIIDSNLENLLTNVKKKGLHYRVTYTQPPHLVDKRGNKYV